LMFCFNNAVVYKRGGLYIAPLLWVVFFIVAIIKFEFQWLLLVSVAIALNMSQLYGYTKCSKDAQARFRTLENAAGQAKGFMYMPLKLGNFSPLSSSQ